MVSVAVPRAHLALAEGVRQGLIGEAVTFCYLLILMGEKAVE